MKQEEAEVISVCLHRCNVVLLFKIQKCIINQALLTVPSDFNRTAAGKKLLQKNFIGKIQCFPSKAQLFTCEAV